MTGSATTVPPDRDGARPVRAPSAGRAPAILRLAAAVLVLLLALASLAARDWAPAPKVGSLSAAAATEPHVAVLERTAAPWLRLVKDDHAAGPAPAAAALPPPAEGRAEVAPETAFPPRAARPRWDPARAPPARAS